MTFRDGENVPYPESWSAILRPAKFVPVTLKTIQSEPKIDPLGLPVARFPEGVEGSGTPPGAPATVAIPETPAKPTQLDKYKRFVPVALAIAAMSKYPGTRVGCVILGQGYEILSSGWNGAPRGSSADVDGRLDDRETRLSWACHAEANSIANAARSGTALVGGTLICTLMPCMACAKSIVQAGIVRVLCPEPTESSEYWHKEFELTRSLFAEVGVELHYCDTTGGQE